MTDTLVVVPTYNECANVPLLVSGLLQHSGVQVLIVDDASPDGTADRAEALARDYPYRLEVMRRTGPRGYGRASLAGLREGLARPVDLVCQMDADLSHDPGQLPRLLAAAADADVVIGSRYVGGGRIENWQWRRRLLSRFANQYIRATTRLAAQDCTSGYRCWRRTALATMPLDGLVSDGYAFLVEMLFVAARSGLRIAEVPITFVERREGQSKMSRAVIIESAIIPWRLAGRRR